MMDDEEYTPPKDTVPDFFSMIVDADDEAEAISMVQDAATEEYGWCFYGCDVLTDFLGNTEDVKAQEVHEAYVAMKSLGGGFMSALADALVKADAVNAEKILITWNEEIRRLVLMNKLF
jgi:hypothetical protein